MAHMTTPHRLLVSTLILTALLTGCTVGPDFKRPLPPEVADYGASTAAGSVGSGAPQHIVAGGPVNRQWWQEFGSAPLNALIEEGLQASPTLAAARATLRQAGEVYSAQAGSSLYPQVDGQLSGQRQRLNPSALGQTGAPREFSLYNAGVGVRYSLDLAGGNRRALEALAARVDYQDYQLAGSRLTLAANIVTTAITRARLARQIQVTEAILLSHEEQLLLTRERVRLGQAAEDEALILAIQVEQSRATIPLLRKGLQQSNHLLLVLTGQAPGSGVLPAIPLEAFTLPSALPLMVPSALVRARPDIQAAEALLHEANAEYGVAIANLYPQLNLSGDLATQALTTGALFGSGSEVWSLVGQLTQPLFNPGLPARKRAALAAFEAAAANYQTVVLEALRNVADVLAALDNDAQRLAALSAASKAAHQSQESMQRRYGLGAASYIELLTAQQQAQQTRIDLIEAQAQRLANSAALYQAMGGGVLTTKSKAGPAPGNE
ncbi:MAG: efflux transporter outer membrane subunit [Desulfurivibrionaceae bacterium]|nr:efflux transporter outer membrane subunit [Desulfurivibrionaceae bacterium]